MAFQEGVVELEKGEEVVAEVMHLGDSAGSRRK